MFDGARVFSRLVLPDFFSLPSLPSKPVRSERCGHACCRLGRCRGNRGHCSWLWHAISRQLMQYLVVLGHHSTGRSWGLGPGPRVGLILAVPRQSAALPTPASARWNGVVVYSAWLLVRPAHRRAEHGGPAIAGTSHPPQPPGARSSSTRRRCPCR